MVHGGPRRKATGTPGPMAMFSACWGLAASSGPGAWGNTTGADVWVADVWVCIPKQDVPSRLGAVSTGLRTRSMEVNGLGIQNWG